MDDLVKLHITDDDEPGRSVSLVMPRSRAERIVSVGLGQYRSGYQFEIRSIEVEGEPVDRLKAAFESFRARVMPAATAALAFASAHKSELAAATVYVASLPLPTPYHQLAALASCLLAGVAGTKYRA